MQPNQKEDVVEEDLQDNLHIVRHVRLSNQGEDPEEACQFENSKERQKLVIQFGHIQQGEQIDDKSERDAIVFQNGFPVGNLVAKAVNVRGHQVEQDVQNVQNERHNVDVVVPGIPNFGVYR